MSRILGKNLLALFFLRFEKMCRIDKGHHDPLDGRAVACQITLRRGHADVRKGKPILKIAHAEKNSVRHALGQLDGTWRRGKARDSAGAESCGPFRRAADLKDCDVFVRF